MTAFILDHIRRIMSSVTELSTHKIDYLISHKSYVCGMWGNLIRYGIEYNQENHELLVEVVQSKLVGNDDIECEWSEEQYNNFVVFDPNLLSKDSYFNSK